MVRRVEMKRFVITMVIALAVTAAVFAQSGSASYTVQEVTGRVERDVGNGKWEAVKAGETLRADAVIRTVIGASLIVKDGDAIFTVGPMKNGKLADIASVGAAIQIQGKVSQTDTGATSRTSGRLSTASARASDAAGEIEIEE
jgi:hypothetical protein